MALIDIPIRLHKNPLCTLRELPVWLIHDLLQPLHAYGLESEHVKDELQMVAPEAREINASLVAMDRAVLIQERSLSSLRCYWRYTGTLPPPELEGVSLGMVVEAAFNQIRRRFRETAFELSGVDGVFVHSDYAELQTVLTLLIENAAIYSRAGIRVCVEGYFENKRALCLDVVDDGGGLPEEIEPLLGSPFIKPTGARSKHAGLGLGIYLATLISTRLGHELTVTSIPGQGCRFRLKLVRAHQLEGAKRNANSLAGLRVLFAEGEEKFAPSVATLISSWGCRINSFRELNPISLPTLLGVSTDVVLMSYRVWVVLQSDLEQLFADAEEPLFRVVVFVHTKESRIRPNLLPTSQAFVKFVFSPISPTRLRSALVACLASSN